MVNGLIKTVGGRVERAARQSQSFLIGVDFGVVAFVSRRRPCFLA